jgi:hypothetical protein
MMPLSQLLLSPQELLARLIQVPLAAKVWEESRSKEKQPLNRATVSARLAEVRAGEAREGFLFMGGAFSFDCVTAFGFGA